jgi:hypothetical protein
LSIIETVDLNSLRNVCRLSRSCWLCTFPCFCRFYIVFSSRHLCSVDLT